MSQVLTTNIQEGWPETEACIDKAIGMIKGVKNLFYKQRLKKVGLFNLVMQNLREYMNFFSLQIHQGKK